MISTQDNHYLQSYNNEEEEGRDSHVVYGDEEERPEKERVKMLNCTKAAVNGVMNVCYNMVNLEIKHFEQNFEYIINEDISDVDT